jgi:hypothetical protein
MDSTTFYQVDILWLDNFFDSTTFEIEKVYAVRDMIAEQSTTIASRSGRPAEFGNKLGLEFQNETGIPKPGR